jgi:hypothetical protein
MRKRFDVIGCPVPTDFHVSVGFKPAGGYESALVMGCCYIRAVSSANVNEIFISPEWDDPIEILATFAHELIHAASDCADGHGAGFKKHAVAFGLTGKMTATYAGPELVRWLGMVAATLGPYPHAKTQIFANKRKRLLTPTTPDPSPGEPGEGGKIHSGRGKQATAMLKVQCDNPTCGFICRATAKNLDLGMPVCGCGTRMSSPQYAESLLDRWFSPHPHYGGQRPDYLIEAEVRAMDEGLAKRREWSRARGYLAAVVAPVAAVVKAAKRTPKPKPVIPAAAVKILDALRTEADCMEPYPATLGEASQYPDEVLGIWEGAETISELAGRLCDELDKLIEA